MVLSRVHLDTDFLVHALSHGGPERRRLLELANSSTVIEMSAIAWYEFTRGPRTPEHIAVAQTLLGATGVIAFSQDLAQEAAECFRRLGSPRRRGSDIAIGITASFRNATLLTRNLRDFAGIRGLEIEAPVGLDESFSLKTNG